MQGLVVPKVKAPRHPWYPPPPSNLNFVHLNIVHAEHNRKCLLHSFPQCSEHIFLSFLLHQSFCWQILLQMPLIVMTFPAVFCLIMVYLNLLFLKSLRQMLLLLFLFSTHIKINQKNVFVYAFLLRESKLGKLNSQFSSVSDKL